MLKIRTLNQIAVKGLDQFSRERFEVSSDAQDPDAILVRSEPLTVAEHGGPRLRAIARAGAGVNNIPVAEFTERGVVVFNTPGANANAVKELVVCALLLASRGIIQGTRFVDALDVSDDAALHAAVEAEKKRFKGVEIMGRTLGVVGLGAIGSLVARAALDLGMHVVGYDPAISIDAAWRLPSEVERMENLPTLFGRADYVTLHVPLLAETRHMVNAESLRSFKPGAVLLNFARDGIVDTAALRPALESGHIARYYADFPAADLKGLDNVVTTPHLGASTAEAEENCAVMAARQLIDFLERGNIRNSVNFPDVSLERNGGVRLAIINRNVPRMLGHMTSIFAEHDINVIDMLNKSRGDVAYNLVDIDCEPGEELIRKLEAIEGVISVRTFEG